MRGAKRERTLVFSGIAGFLLSLVLIAFLIAPREQSYRLPDGTLVALLGSSYGKQHPLVRRSRNWMRFFLPPEKVEDLTTPDDALVLWVYTSTVAASRPHFAPTVHWWDWAEVTDGQGHTIVSSNRDVRPPYSRISTANVDNNSSAADPHNEPLVVHAFPRRGATVTVRFYVANRARPVAVFTVPNPVKKAYPPSAIAKLPQSAQDGDVRCDFKGVGTPDVAGFVMPNGTMFKSGASISAGALRGETKGLRLLFDFSRGRRRALDLSYDAVTLTDVTGNRYDIQDRSASGAGPVSVFAAQCSGEPTQVHLRMVNTAEGFRPAASVWRAPPIRLPGANQVVLIHRTVRNTLPAGIKGSEVTAELLGVAGPGRSKWGAGPADTLTSNVYSARLIVTPAGGNPVFLKISDDRGRPVGIVTGSGQTPGQGWQDCLENSASSDDVVTNFTFISHSHSWSMTSASGAVYRTYFFVPQPGAKHLQIEAAVSRSYDFDFLIPPQP